MRREEPTRAHPRRNGERAREIDRDVEQLKANPGRWALVVEDATSDVGRRPYRRRGCETASRGPLGGPISIYARWPAE